MMMMMMMMMIMWTLVGLEKILGKKYKNFSPRLWVIVNLKSLKHSYEEVSK
jgi:hypothetical protein